jgi:two-component system, chemotaxis family, sensor kinase CheA
MIDKFKQGFLEEARELLVELESALLELDQNRGDLEVVGRAFRALHTIKGSGAMFGFDDIAAFTHTLETAFDELRTGHLTATSDLINLTLAAGDQIKAMLDESTGIRVADRSRSAGILAELHRLTGSSKVEPAIVAAQVLESRPADAETCRPWHIHFRPNPDILLNGTNPALLLRELREMGELRTAVDTSAIPPLSQMDTGRCYLAWDLILNTTATAAAIRDVFIFVEDDCELLIETPSADTSAADVPVVTAPGESVAPVRSQIRPAATSSIRVSAEKLDDLVNLVGELVTVRARLNELSARRDDPDIQAVSEEVDRLAAELRDNSMSLRMLPLRTTFERFRRLVHDLGIELHKDVEFTVEGADTELDKTVIDQLSDPLVHLVRNSMDHGIEKPEARRAAGKNPTAKIHLSARHSGANVLIQLSDDGRGLDVEAVRARAIERGLIDPAAQLSAAEVSSLIMEPGFSTAQAVTDLSGRGVGLDVVRRNIEGLRGLIEIENKPGLGLTVTLRLPLTLAIIDGILVRVGWEHFVLPLANCLECIELTKRDRDRAGGNRIANVRGEIIPYIRLSEYFEMGMAPPDLEQIMIVETEHGHYGFVVDQVLGNSQTVIKNLGAMYRNVQVVSGATILGNGTVALILDPHRLAQNAVQAVSQGRRSDGRRSRQNIAAKTKNKAGNRIHEQGRQD